MFKRSIPGVVTTPYLAAALDMKEASARVNVLTYLRDIGLIDAQGKTQMELAKTWRDDTQYAKVCGQIREAIYPEELRAAAPEPWTDRKPAETWVASHTGAGTAAVRRMVQFYIVLMEADVTKKPQTDDGPRKGTGQDRKSALTSKPHPERPVPASTHSTNSAPAVSPDQQHGGPVAPGVYINLQIHISADATPEQIDKIFESMSKHIYRKP
jgi:hypothetical protein